MLGGSGIGINFNDGGLYNPTGNSWTAIPNTLPNTPSVRTGHTAVWTGSEMIVWGGVGGSDFNDGGRYHPAGNTWAAVSTIGAPGARRYHEAVWAGSEMIVWGGYFNSRNLNTGGRYHPSENSWTPVSTTGAPAARYHHTAVWTGSEMIVWGGTDTFAQLRFDDGGRYNPAANRWTAVTTTGAPAPRYYHTAVWTGSEMIVWGGYGGSVGDFNDTFSYTPGCGAFRITSAVLDSGNLTVSFPSVTGRTYTLWRSETLTSGSWTNTGLAALTGTGTLLTFTLPAPTAGVPRRFFRVHADP